MITEMNTRRLLSSLAVTVVVVLVLLAVIFRTQTIDLIKSIGYTPSAEIAALRDDIQLNGPSYLIFSATRPQLDERATFADVCNSTDADTAVLGCYTPDDHVHVYNVTLPELSGIQQSTLAHELLHAIYARHPAATLSYLEPLLRQAYQDHPELQADLANYSSDEFLTEVHSRLGTEVANLSPELETYYAKYFQNQDHVVSFYDQYHSQMVSLRNQSDQQRTQLEQLQHTMTTKTEDYQSRSDTLTAQIADFNRRAAAGQFSVQADFNRERNALITERDNLDALFKEISALTDQYNTLVDTYNANVLHLNTVRDAITSSPPPAVE
jgi:hypothetical protein